MTTNTEVQQGGELPQDERAVRPLMKFKAMNPKTWKPDYFYLCSEVDAQRAASVPDAGREAIADPVCETGMPMRKMHRWFRRVAPGTLLYEAAPQTTEKL